MAICERCSAEFEPPEEGDIVKTGDMEERVVWNNGKDPGVPGYRERRERVPVERWEPRCEGCL